MSACARGYRVKLQHQGYTARRTTDNIYIIIIIYHEKSQLNRLVWGSLTLAPIIYICVVRRAAYPKLIQFNARNVHKICIVQTPRVLQWSVTAILQQESPSHQGTEKTDCSVEESERELVVPLKLRNRERNG